MEKRDKIWYLSNPTRLLNKKPFTRGGELTTPLTAKISLTTKREADFGLLQFNEITQDTYLEEYDPTLHRIKFNQSIPHISVKIGGRNIVIDDMILTAAFQKNIHAAHTLHLTARPMEFTLCNIEKDEQTANLFQIAKQEWLLRNMESIKYDVISKQQKVGDVGLLFYFDKVKNQFKTRVYSYDDGYIVIPNYNEYNEQIGCSLYYKDVEGNGIIDFYDDKNHYHLWQSTDGVVEEMPEGLQITPEGWNIHQEEHGFSSCPLLYKRGKVAWEYAESTIEMWELMANINAVALKRFGTFALIIKGALSEKQLKMSNSTLVINLSAEADGGKQDAKTLEFPEPQKMLEYLSFLEEQISIFSSTSFITPKDVTNSNSGGNGIFLAMKNDLALATQSVADWSEFTNDMMKLFLEGLSLETSDSSQYTKLKIYATLKPWSMESESTKITNLAMERKWLSGQSIREKSPDAAPDEEERIRREKAEEAEAAIEPDATEADALSAKAERISRNNNSSLQNLGNKTVDSSDLNKE